MFLLFFLTELTHREIKLLSLNSIALTFIKICLLSVIGLFNSNMESCVTGSDSGSVPRFVPPLNIPLPSVSSCVTLFTASIRVCMDAFDFQINP